MEANQLLFNDVILILNSLKLLNNSLFAVESRPKREFTSMLADAALEGISILHSLFDLHFHFSLIS